MSCRGHRYGRRVSRPRSQFRPEGAKLAAERLEPRQLLATIQVTSLADSTTPPVDGQVTLREAIQSINAGMDANADLTGHVNGTYGTQDRIIFDGLAGTIALASSLPAITRAVVVDGSTGAGFSGSPVITINAQGASTAITIQGPDVAVRSFALINAGQAGVLVTGGSATRAVIAGNEVGLDRDGTAVANLYGIQINAGASAATIGGATAADRNVISGNGVSGVLIEGASANVVRGNFVGTDPSGTVDLGNGFVGIHVRNGSTGNVIGGENPTAFLASAGNVISGNGDDGVRLEGTGTSGNLVAGNFIGLDVSGTRDLGNDNTGIEVNTAASNTVGGIGASLANVIAGNAGDGILLFRPGASANLIQGNRIGTNAAGIAAIGNAEDGIEVNQAVGNTIGGATAGAGNLISGNASDGIELEDGAASNVVQGNFIGTNATGTGAVPNVESGVRLDAGLNTTGGTITFNGARANTIGGINATVGTATAGNLISGNGRNGVVLFGRGTTGNAIVGNFIGTDLAGSAALGNSLNGVLVDGAVGNRIGQTNISVQSGVLRAGNLVSGNGGDGIRLEAYTNTSGDVLSVSSANLVSGNFVGPNASGTGIIGNAGNGIALIGAANSVGGFSANTIGGVNSTPFSLSAGNLVSGNSVNGVVLRGNAVSGNLLIGNFVGTNAGGSSALPNGRLPSTAGPIDPRTGNGVFIDQGTTANTIGGGNLVSGNRYAGVVLDAAPSNLITGNRIGTNAAGTTDLGNGTAILPAGATDPNGDVGVGVRLRNGSTGNTVGGRNTDPSNPTAGNLVSGNIYDGISLFGSGTSGNLIAGNRVGTNASGSNLVPNGLDGVKIDGGTRNTVGGTAAGLRNLLTGNQSDGAQLSGGASRNVVLGNFIGLDAAGTTAPGNGDNGVYVNDASDNTIGGLDPLDGQLLGGNVIAGNFDGIRIRDSIATTTIPTTGNLVVGNFVGTDAAGTVGLGNRDDGVQIISTGNNTIGGSVSGSANLISSNRSNGVVIGGDNITASGNLVIGNLIGTNYAGSVALGNGAEGVLLAASAIRNTIGGVNATAGIRSVGNLISGNTGSGVRIINDGASANLVLGNFIGTNAAGNVAVANKVDGVLVEGRPSNTIGGANGSPGSLTAGNLIAGNSGNGVRLLNAGASNNLVLGNFIGTNVSGNAAVANGADGVLIDGGSTNTVGGLDASARNVVSGNTGVGVRIVTASGNAVFGNFIGTNSAGTTPVANGFGVVIASDATANTVGAGNVASGNTNEGIRVAGTANLITTNFAGTDARRHARPGQRDRRHPDLWWFG